MTIDWWGLGLQAVNVLILVWLLSRVFWRPVAGAIAKRQETTQAMLDSAAETQAKADAVIADVAEARAGIAAEREAALAEAAAKAEAETAAAQARAHEAAEKILDAARLARERDAETARKASAAHAADLAVDIAGKLLGRLDASAAQAAFLDPFVEAIAQLPPNDRAALRAKATGVEMVSAAELDDAHRARLTEAIRQAIGGEPALTFVTDPDLIAGLELRTEHFSLRNSWRSDLADILKAVTHAA